MSRPDWPVLAPKTSALGSRPDSIACSLPPPTPLLHARPPATALAEVSQLFHVAKPFTLPENERSHAPALKPISACTAEAHPRARAAAATSEVFLCLVTPIICTSFRSALFPPRAISYSHCGPKCILVAHPATSVP